MTPKNIGQTTITTTYRQKGEAEPIRAQIRLVNPNQIELKQRQRGSRTGRIWYYPVIVTTTGAMTPVGAMVFSNAYTEFYISPADWRRLTGIGFEVAKER